MKSFLQSKEWEEFQKSLGRETFWIDGKLLIKLPLMLGQNYLYSARPEFKSVQELNKFLSETKKLAKTGSHIFFIRFEPVCAQNVLKDKHCQQLKKTKFKQPQDTLILELKDKSEETILSEMKQKTRYNIRLAKKKGVKIRVSNNPTDIDIFYDLGLETAKRDNIKFHPQEYYKKMLEVLGVKNILKLYIAEFDGKPIAANLVLFYNKTAVYLHGASSNSHRNVMAPYLLQWQTIRDAKKSGCSQYDFWGIVSLEKEKSEIRISKYETNSNFQNLNGQNKAKISNPRSEIPSDHAWAGITRFKLGFAPYGKIVHYPGCFEVVFRQGRYLLYSFLRRK